MAEGYFVLHILVAAILFSNYWIGNLEDFEPSIAKAIMWPITLSIVCIKHTWEE